MRSKSFSRFFRERSEVRVTTSLMPDSLLVHAFRSGIFFTYEGLWCTLGKHRRRMRRVYPRT